MCLNKSQHQKEMPIGHQFLHGLSLINPYPKIPAVNTGRNFLLQNNFKIAEFRPFQYKVLRLL